MPHFNHEKHYWNNDGVDVIGLDEVGRGPFAGPVVVGAVIMPQGIDESDVFGEIQEVNDSKKLTKKKRDELAEKIKKHAGSWAIGATPAHVIDRIGIREAIKQAAEKAIYKLPSERQKIISDWKLFARPEDYECVEIPFGDGESLTIAAASIIAKVWRDAYMQELSELEGMDVYGWDRNSGYGTKEHQQAIVEHGVTLYHRKSFLKKLLGNNHENR